MPFCPKCGENMDSNADFCYFCGAKNPKLIAGVSQPLQAASAASEGLLQTNGQQYAPRQTPLSPTAQGRSEPKAKETAKAQPKKRKGVKLALVGGLAVLLVAVGAVLAIMLTKSSKEPEASAGRSAVETLAPLHAVQGPDGHYILLEDGTAIQINARNVRQAIMTPNRQTIVVLLEDGTLYATNREQTEKTELGQVSGTISVNNDYEATTDIYNEKYDTYMRQIFHLSGAEILEEDDKLYLVTAEGEKAYLADSRQVTRSAVTPRGPIAVWMEDRNSYVYNHGKTYELGQIRNGWSVRVEQATRDGEVAVVSVLTQDSGYAWYLVQKGKQPIEFVDSPWGLTNWYSSRSGDMSDYFLTEDGPLEEVDAAQVSTLIFNPSKGLGKGFTASVYSLADGQMADYQDICITESRNGTVTYWDYTGENRVLCCGKLNGLQITEQTVLTDASGWTGAESSAVLVRSLISPDGKYIFYTAGKEQTQDGKTGVVTALYCYKLGESQPQEVCTTVYTDDFRFWVGEEGAVYMVDGGYYMGADQIFGDEEFFRTYGFPDLKLWRYGDAQPTTICENIIVEPDETFAPIGQGFADRYDRLRAVPEDGLVFPAIVEWTEYENPTVQWLYYDGETVKVLMEIPN